MTINGQSAGASSVELHLVADVGEQLFSGAIAQSVYRTVLPLPAQQAVSDYALQVVLLIHKRFKRICSTTTLNKLVAIMARSQIR